MDVHIYKKGKYVRTERNVRPMQVIGLNDDEIVEIPTFLDSVPDATGDSTNPELPATRWPEGSEL